MKKSSIAGIIIIALAIGIIISTYADSSTYGSFADATETTSELHIVGQLNKEKELSLLFTPSDIDDLAAKMEEAIRDYDLLRDKFNESKNYTLNTLTYRNFIQNLT